MIPSKSLKLFSFDSFKANSTTAFIDDERGSSCLSMNVSKKLIGLKNLGGTDNSLVIPSNESTSSRLAGSASS